MDALIESASSHLANAEQQGLNQTLSSPPLRPGSDGDEGLIQAMLQDHEARQKRDGTPYPGETPVSEDFELPDAPTNIINQQPQAPIVQGNTLTPPASAASENDEAPELNVLSGGMRGMVDLVNRLRAAGIEDLGLQLPRIAVVGNQSAGKSSLIEAISGIKVPRATGTCTRCPLEINLRESTSPWKCTVSLRFKKRHDPSQIYGTPWVDQPTKQVFFYELHDKNGVQSVLVRAQNAILSPSTHYKEFVEEIKHEQQQSSTRNLRGGGFSGFGKRDNSGEREVQFSPNVIVMDITGPGLPNLAFIDLPGVIQTTENASENYLITLVTSLIKEYIEQDDCLILLTMTMKDDAVNQSAVRLARELGEDRTIGALTKPDTVEFGEHGQWVNILQGKSHKLEHGYFVTKQPNQEQLMRNVSHEEAREMERQFFDRTAPWCDELAGIRERFGTQALAKYLAVQLEGLFLKCLPGINDTIRRQAAEVENELRMLPAPPDNQTLTVTDLVNNFDRTVREHMVGMNGKNTFQKALRDAVQDFQTSLKGLRPRLVVLSSPEEEQNQVDRLRTPRTNRNTSARKKTRTELQQMRDREGSPLDRMNGGSAELPRNVELEVIESEDDEPAPKAQPSSEKKRRQNAPLDSYVNPTTPAKKQKRSTVTPGGRIAVMKEGWSGTLPEIRHILESTSTARLPGQVAPEATNKLIRVSLEPWDDVISNFLVTVRTTLEMCFHSCFISTFKPYERTPLYGRVFNILKHFLEEKFEHVEELIKIMWKWEREQTGTLNTLDYERFKQNHRQVLKEKRRRNLEEQREASLLDENGNPLKGRKRAAAAQAEKDFVDPFKRELVVLAEVRAYHEIARNRMTDYADMCVQAEWVKQCGKSVRTELKTELRLETSEADEECRKMLVENPEEERRRKELLAKREQLALAMQEIARASGERQG